MIDGECVYVCFGDFGVWVFDMVGEFVWDKWIFFKKMMSDWGLVFLFVLVDNKFIVFYDNEEELWFVVFDLKIGEEVWWVLCDEVLSWVMFYIWKNDLCIEIVILGCKKICFYDFVGNVFWEMDGCMFWVVIVMLFLVYGLFYVILGYFQDFY